MSEGTAASAPIETDQILEPLEDEAKLFRFPPNKINVLLLEKVNSTGVAIFRESGFNVTEVSRAYSEEELLAIIPTVHAIGIRSKTQLSKKVLEAAKRLLCIGCFCIGTDQVFLPGATEKGVPVFNSPYGNTRSVSELVLAEIIMLSRQASDRTRELHRGEWKKTSDGCFEVRGKVLGLVGYGHVGSQLSILAEALGMQVLFYDVVPKLALGSAKPVASLSVLLQRADFVSLHVPADASTKGLIGAAQVAQMHPGSYLINASRGNVVDVAAAAAALRSGHLAGGAFDVFPSEPAGSCKDFVSELQECPNTILTPHIGGSTEEAQAAIGEEVARKMVDFINRGPTIGAVNVPGVSFTRTLHPGHSRVLSFHKNMPGVLRDINRILSSANIVAQTLETGFGIGYLVVDVESETTEEINQALKKMENSIRTRVLLRGSGAGSA